MMTTDELIARLAADASPVRPLAAPAARTAWWALTGALSVTILVIALSPNLERLLAIRAPRFWLEQIAAFAAATAAATAALRSVVPGRERSWTLPVAPFLGWLAVIAVGVAQDWGRRGDAALVVHADLRCVGAIAVTAALPLVMIVPMLRRGAPFSPALTMMLAGAAGALLGTITGCLSRPVQHGSTLTVLVWHVGTVGSLMLLAAASGPFLLRWPPRSLQ